MVINSFSSVIGLESDDSCEVSFKDALVPDAKRTSNGHVPTVNGVSKRRYVVVML